MIEGSEVTSSKGAVAAGPDEAARIGGRILEAGGNAMDAASATSLACCMLAPASTGVGGYVCCATVLDGRTGRVWSVDANAVAPAAAREDMYEVHPPRENGNSLNEREYACYVKDDANVYGPLAVGVPGMMAGMGIIWERWGRLKWADVVAPSLELLERGFAYGDGLVAFIKSMEPVVRRFGATARHLMPDGKLPEPDGVWHRPDMDKTLARIAEAGWRDFYEGEIGRTIADYLQQAGGVMTRDDMARYEPRVTDPYTITYRGAAVHGPILTNGAITTLQALNMLECLPPSRQDDVAYWHALAEVLKLAWRDRLRYLADPGFVDVPVTRLLSKDYAAGRVERVRRCPEHVDTLIPPAGADPASETLHVSTADAEGNAVSMTITQGMAFGSCTTVPGTGIILGHGMCRFDPRPGRANSVAPGKQPLNNAASLMVQLPDRDVATGLPGGRKIVSVMARAAQLLVDRGATGHQSAVAPRMHVEMAEPVEVTRDVGEDVVAGLRAMGHDVKLANRIAGALNTAEVRKGDRSVRAGGNALAVGVS